MVRCCICIERIDRDAEEFGEVTVGIGDTEIQMLAHEKCAEEEGLET